MAVSDIKRLSEQIVEFGERMGNVADAAQGKDGQRTLRARWFVLPAAGAGLYALITNRTLGRQAREVVNEARTRASDLPEDLLKRVNKATRSEAARSASNGRRTTRRRTASGRRKTASKAS